MRRTWSLLPIFGGSLLFTANISAVPPPASAAGAGTVAAAPSTASAEEKQLRPLLDRLGELSRLIGQNTQSPRSWEYHLEQAEVLLRLAALSKDKERDNMMRMAVDDVVSATLLAPRGQTAAYQQLQQLPQRIAQAFPGSPLVLYAILQEIQVDCTRVLESSGGDQRKANKHRHNRLIQFAQQHPNASVTPKVILEAGKVAELLKEWDAARRCYRYLIAHYSATAEARKAGGALRRLGQNQDPLSLKLPLLYVSNNPNEATFNLTKLRGRWVVVYFWSSTSPHAAEDFETLKHFTDRSVSRDLAVVYVNMDDDAKQARDFLSGRLTAGVHLYQSGGLNGALAQRYGILEVPQAFLIGKDGRLLRHSLPASALETAFEAAKESKNGG